MKAEYASTSICGRLGTGESPRLRTSVLKTHTCEHYFPRVYLENVWDGILGDALSHLPLHLSPIPHFHSLSSSAWSALLKPLTQALLLQGSHDASTGAHCKWGRPRGRGEWAGAARNTLRRV